MKLDQHMNNIYNNDNNRSGLIQYDFCRSV